MCVMSLSPPPLVLYTTYDTLLLFITLTPSNYVTTKPITSACALVPIIYLSSILLPNPSHEVVIIVSSCKLFLTPHMKNT